MRCGRQPNSVERAKGNAMDTATTAPAPRPLKDPPTGGEYVMTRQVSRPSLDDGPFAATESYDDRCRNDD
jgi:hypothetical protein